METLQIERQGGVGVLWLNRPEKRNALNRAMLAELGQAFTELAADAQVRVVVLAGRGASFCAGFDVEPRTDGTGYGAPAEAVADYADLDARMSRFLEVWDHPKPIVAAVHGHCLAAATLLCVLADLTLVASDAKIGLAAMPLGGGYLEPAWVHLVGPKRAKQLALIPGETISGETAAAWGWANYAVDPAKLMDEARSLAARMARMPAEVLQLRKKSINRMVELGGLKEGLRTGPLTDALLHQSAAIRTLREAIAADGLKEALRRFQSGELDT